MFRSDLRWLASHSSADVQVVRGLVQEQQVGLLEHGARERQAHAPAPRQLRDCFPHRVLREPDRLQAWRRVVRVRAHLARVRLDETENGVLHRGEHFVLHEDAAQVFGPAVYVPRGETRQQGGLPRAVLADHAVLASPHESKVRRLQKHLPGEREDYPSQIQTVFLDGVVVVPSGGGPVLAVLAAPAAREMTHCALEESRDRVVVDELAQHGARGVHEFLHHLLRRPPGLALGQGSLDVATYSLTSSSTDVEASRDLTCASTSGTGISPVVAGDAYDHKGRARPAVGDNEVGKGLSVFLRTGA